MQGAAKRSSLRYEQQQRWQCLSGYLIHDWTVTWRSMDLRHAVLALRSSLRVSEIDPTPPVCDMWTHPQYLLRGDWRVHLSHTGCRVEVLKYHQGQSSKSNVTRNLISLRVTDIPISIFLISSSFLHAGRHRDWHSSTKR